MRAPFYTPAGFPVKCGIGFQSAPGSVSWLAPGHAEWEERNWDTWGAGSQCPGCQSSGAAARAGTGRCGPAAAPEGLAEELCTAWHRERPSGHCPGFGMSSVGLCGMGQALRPLEIPDVTGFSGPHCAALGGAEGFPWPCQVGSSD